MCVMLVLRTGEFATLFCWGRLLLPNPAGALPRSVELPCASHLRMFEPGFGRCELLTPPRLALPSAFVRILEFGLSSESSCCRGDTAPLFAAPLFIGPRFADALPRPTLPEFSKVRPALPGRSVAGRTVPAPKERVGMCEAPAAGVLRATTARFCTAAEGVATRPEACAAPK